MAQTLDYARLSTADRDFAERLEALGTLAVRTDTAVRAVATEIIDAVRARGDAAVLEFTNRYDGRALERPEQFVLPPAALQAALHALDAEVRAALQAAASRIRAYHERQRLESWSYTDADGTRLGQRVTALERVGVYVPGGKAAYPSSVLMNVIPARVAGVDEVIMVVPAPRGELNGAVLAAAAIAGVDRVFTIGGAQAIAALAHGTATVPGVDKIVGPGNAYVAAAKALVFGRVGIDMIAGPSEIVVICDGLTDPDWIAMDLCAQAEHDETAQAILLSPDAKFLERVDAALARLVPELPRAAVVSAALAARGALIHTRDLDEAVELANHIAPEHLELSVETPGQWVDRIRHAGAIFLGRYTPEAFGDYCAGPNHVLPTARTARFSSPLGVYDFQKRTSLIEVGAAGAKRLGAIASVLAMTEGLQAHAQSARYRTGSGGEPADPQAS